MADNSTGTSSGWARLDDLVATYDADGVIRVPALLTDEEVDDVRHALDRYIRDVVPTLPASDVVFEADGRSVRNLWRIEAHDDFFAELARRPRLTELVGALLHGDPVPIAVETFNKPARHGSGVPPHQDNAYFCLEPPDVLTVWVAIDAATRDNGPIQYAPGTAAALLPHKASRIPGNSMVLADPPAVSPERAVTALLAPGDAMVHHGQTIHWSGPNTTGEPRCGLLLVYRASHTMPSAPLRNAYHAATAALRDA